MFYKKTEVLLPVLVVDMFEIFTTQCIGTILMLDGTRRFSKLHDQKINNQDFCLEIMFTIFQGISLGY